MRAVAEKPEVPRASDAPRAKPAPTTRRMPIGAEVVDGGVSFRVWAPELTSVDVVLADEMRGVRLESDAAGYHSGVVNGIAAGARYWFQLPDGRLLPDPVSRFQPEGPHGPSEVVDPDAFAWTDAAWKGVTLPGQIVCEIHVGTFTPEGTWRAAIARLDDLVADGVGIVEVMPVASFPGRFGWGYDGVDLFAPVHLYGRPDDFRAFVDAAHARGLGVILDVVYNHFGPDGNYLDAFSSRYFAAAETEWGRAINYDGDGSAAVRELVAENASYWIREFHLDGLRLDATQSIFDRSPEHIVAELTRRARAAAGKRSIVVVAENEPQQTELVRAPDQGGQGLDGLWNDDLHHSAFVAATGRREAYYTDYLGSAQELLSAVKHGYLYQGQRYQWQKKRRGHPSRGLPSWRFVAYLENHDQVANSLRGWRLWQQTSPGKMRALRTLLMLAPWTPMLLQGEPWGASAPFLYFADHKPELAALVKSGRAEFLAQFPGCNTPAARALLLDPHDPAAFERCRVDWGERERSPHRETLAMHRELVRLRREDPTVAGAIRGQAGVAFDGAVIGPACFVLRLWRSDGPDSRPDDDDRLLVVNLGVELRYSPCPEPLVAPPPGRRWQPIFATEDARWSGCGVPQPETEDDGWVIPAESALLLAPAALEGASDGRG